MAEVCLCKLQSGEVSLGGAGQSELGGRVARPSDDVDDALSTDIVDDDRRATTDQQQSVIVRQLQLFHRVLTAQTQSSIG